MLLLREEKFAIFPVADGETAALNPTMAVFGNNKTATFDTDGGIILTAYVNGQSAQTAILGASADTDNPFAVGLLTDDSPAFRAVIRTGASIADVALYAGMRQTNVVATGTDARLTLGPETELVKVQDRSYRREGSTIVVPLGQLGQVGQGGQIAVYAEQSVGRDQPPPMLRIDHRKQQFQPLA